MKIGLIGNQNSGKTTLFNCLTGMNAKIGNWPGVTIEKKTGILKGTKHEITDLPGIYSLSPYSAEEEISRKFIFEEKPDLIINIIDATSIERSLYLTTQLMELDCNVIIALNMSDILEKKGFIINIKKMEELLGVTLCKISALKETGIEELVKKIEKYTTLNKIKVFDSNIEKASNKIINILDSKLSHKKFIAINLLENDLRFKLYENSKITIIKQITKKDYDTDMEEIVAMQRYNFIEKIKRNCVIKKKVSETISDKLDKIFLNKFAAFPIFVAIMFKKTFLMINGTC